MKIIYLLILCFALLSCYGNKNNGKTKEEQTTEVKPYRKVPLEKLNSFLSKQQDSITIEHLDVSNNKDYFHHSGINKTEYLKHDGIKHVYDESTEIIEHISY